GVCLVDTFETVEKQQSELGFFNEENTDRVKRQRAAPIKVIIANPPYNAGQLNENDNNKNRKYPEIDARVKRTYAAASNAQLVRRVYDPLRSELLSRTDRTHASPAERSKQRRMYVSPEHRFQGICD